MQQRENKFPWQHAKSNRVQKLQVRLTTAGLLSGDQLCLYLYELVENVASNSLEVFRIHTDKRQWLKKYSDALIQQK